MADSKELQTQLQINQQINKVLADRSKQLDAMAKQIGGQAQLAKELCKAMECQELDGLEDRIDTITQSLNEASAAASAAGSSLASMGDDADKATSGTRDTLGDILANITPMKAAAVGAGTGFAKSFSKLPGLLSMVGGGLKSVVGNLFSVGKSIVSIPFKILGGFIDAAASTTGGTNQLKVAMNELKEEMGDLATGEGKAVMDGFDSLRSSSSALAKSGLSVSKVFGTGSEGAAAMLQAVGDIAKAAGPSFSMLSDQIAGAADKMVMMNKGLGMSNEALAEMARKAHNTGKDVGSELVEMGSMAIQMGEKFGVSAKTIGKNMSTLTEDVANFGNMSKKELAATATYMAKLGLEAKDLQGVIGKFDDFESAADGVSQLNQAFGIQLDTMEMMNAENPAERIDMMRDAFHAAGKSVEDMTRQEKALMAEQMGLSVSAMENALAQENMGVAYEDMAEGAEEAEANKMSEVEVMQELAKSVKQLTKSGQGVTGFFDAFSKGFERGFAKNEAYKKSLQAIKESFVKVGEFGEKLGAGLAELFEHFGLFDAISAIFDPDAIGGLLDDILGYFDMFKQSTMSGGEYSFGDMIEDIFGSVSDYFTSGEGAEGASLFGDFFANIITFMGDAIASLIPFLAEKVAGLMTSLADMLTGEGEKAGGEGGSAIGNAFSESFSKIGDALAEAWPPLWEALKKLTFALLEKFGPFLFKVMAAMVAIKIAKAVVAGLIEAAGAAIVTKIIGMFTKKVGGDVGKGLDKNAGEAMKKESGGFFDGMKNMIEKIGEISPTMVAKAGFNLLILAAFAAVSLAAFAAGILVAYKILESVPFSGLVKVFAALALSMLAMVPFVMAALMMEPATITTAGLMMLVGAAFFAVSVIAFAAAIRVAYEMLKPVNFLEFAAILGMVGMALLATIALGAVGLAFGSFLPVVPVMILGMVVAAGLFTAGILIFAKAIEKVMPTFKKLAQNAKPIEFSINAIIDVVKTIALMSVLGAAFAPLFLFYKVLVKGFSVAAKFFVKASASLGKMIKAIEKIPITNPDDVKKRIEIVMLVAKAMESMAAIGLDAAKLGAVTEMAGGTTITELFESMGGFIEKIGTTLGNLVMLIVMMAAGLDESQMKGVEVIATVIDAIAGLANALFSPLEAVSKMSSGMFGPSVTEVMSAVTTGLGDLMTKVQVVLPDLVGKIIEIGNTITDPEGMKPKMEVISIALGAIGDFAGAIAAVAELMPEEGGGFFKKGKTMSERLGEMGDIITKVVEAVKSNIGPLVKKIVGIDIGGDAAGVKAKVEVVSLAIKAVSDFASAVQKLSGLNMEASDISSTIAELSQGVYESVSMEVSGYNLNEVFKGLATFAPDEAALAKMDIAIDTMKKLGSFSKQAQRISEQFMGEEWNASVVIAEMVQEAQAAVDALNGVGELNAVAALDNFAQAIGTGEGSFNITNEPVNITLNVQVTMDANKIGKVLVDKSVMTTALSTAEG